MRRCPPAVRLAAGLWVTLAVVLWNVTFDWDTRAAATAFATAQWQRRGQDLPPVTINDGFQPMVRTAAARSSVWAGLVLAVGACGLALAARHRTLAPSYPRTPAP